MNINSLSIECTTERLYAACLQDNNFAASIAASGKGMGPEPHADEATKAIFAGMYYGYLLGIHGGMKTAKIMLEMAFKKGQRVRYIPMHAHGDREHQDCKDGVVKAVGDLGSIFVLYDNAVQIMLTGDEPYTAAGTRPKDLIHI